MTEDHDCTSNLALEKSDVVDGTSVIAGTLTEDGFVAFMECVECGEQFDIEYEYSETVEA